MNIYKTLLLLVIVSILNLSCKEASTKSNLESNEVSKANHQISKNSNQMKASINDRDNELMLDIDKIPLKTKIEGTNLKLFLIAFDAFKKEQEIALDKKKIENYEIEIYENKKYFYVVFQPKIVDGVDDSDGGETSLGKEVDYTIDKNTFEIKARYFSK